MAPAAIRWMINTVFMAVMSMILTCLTAAMAGYALAKKRFVGRSSLYTLIVCAMALPKQVILIRLPEGEVRLVILVFAMGTPAAAGPKPESRSPGLK